MLPNHPAPCCRQMWNKNDWAAHDLRMKDGLGRAVHPSPGEPWAWPAVPGLASSPWLNDESILFATDAEQPLAAALVCISISADNTHF